MMITSTSFHSGISILKGAGMMCPAVLLWAALLQVYDIQIKAMPPGLTAYKETGRY